MVRLMGFPVDPIENPRQVFRGHAFSGILEPNHGGIRSFRVNFDFDLSPRGGMFDGIGHQVFEDYQKSIFVSHDDREIREFVFQFQFDAPSRQGLLERR